MKFYQLTTFLDKKDLDALQEEYNTGVDGILAKVLADMLDNVEEIDDELTYSDSSRFDGVPDGEPE